MTIPAQVLELVERFERNLDVYKRPDYKEARVRVEFVDPLFEALGWDVHNVQGYAEQYKDVHHCLISQLSERCPLQPNGRAGVRVDGGGNRDRGECNHVRGCKCGSMQSV